MQSLSKSDRPRLSLVLPTTGNPRSVRRVLTSLRNNAPPSLLAGAELILFLNINPDLPFDDKQMAILVGEVEPLFLATTVIRTDTYHITAETSALAAVRHATGEYLWIVGDKRVFLPEGLALLDEFIREPTAPCAYFNSIWFDQSGKTRGLATTHFSSPTARVTHKQFVISQGINYIATGMGVWIYQRHLLDLDVWQTIIETCGPHFSHVTALSHGMRDLDVLCHAAFLVQIQEKAYHGGDSDEWTRYAKISNTYRHYAWTFGIVRQFMFLINSGIYRFSDIRRGMCSETLVLRRQVDEIYVNVFLQLQMGRTSPAERIKPEEFHEIMQFLHRACPEHAILNQNIEDFYAGLLTDSYTIFWRKFKNLRNIHGDGLESRLLPLVVSQIGGSYVRLHPRGYLISNVTDRDAFLVAYKLLNPPEHGPNWRILREDEFSALATEFTPTSFGELFPVMISDDRKPSARHRMVLFLFKFRPVAWVLSHMSERLKQRLKRIVLR